VIKLAQEKDKVIENLRMKEQEMLEQQSTDQGTHMVMRLIVSVYSCHKGLELINLFQCYIL
jgi:hypothetical protein